MKKVRNKVEETGGKSKEVDGGRWRKIKRR